MLGVGDVRGREANAVGGVVDGVNMYKKKDLDVGVEARDSKQSRAEEEKWDASVVKEKGRSSMAIKHMFNGVLVLTTEKTRGRGVPKPTRGRPSVDDAFDKGGFNELRKFFSLVLDKVAKIRGGLVLVPDELPIVSPTGEFGANEIKHVEREKKLGRNGLDFSLGFTTFQDNFFDLIL